MFIIQVTEEEKAEQQFITNGCDWDVESKAFELYVSTVNNPEKREGIE